MSHLSFADSFPAVFQTLLIFQVTCLLLLLALHSSAFLWQVEGL